MCIRDRTEEALLDAIKKKLSECPNLSYKKIVMIAGQENRKEIALTLLKSEDSIKDQIPILVNIEEYKTALNVAISNCEADSVYGIISSMRNAGIKMTEIANLCGKIKGFGIQLMSYIYERQRVNPSDEELRTFLYNIKDPEILKELEKAGVADMEECKTLGEIIHTEHYRDLRHRIDVVCGFKNSHTKIKQPLENYYNFLDFKIRNLSLLIKKGINPGQKFVVAESLFETIEYMASKKDLEKLIEPLVKGLKVEPKFVLMIRLRAMARAGDWAKFNDVAKKEKPKLPLYYAQMCVKFGNSELAMTYIRVLNNPEEKIDLLLDIEYLFFLFIENIKRQWRRPLLVEETICWNRYSCAQSSTSSR
eukprot:TRINITY_DN20601_c0_g2_i1.p1 TRINITY_DN20601_c0_g2~~TRINITY_DN20601_c0_g2_i1.p1  ORF type:complete len:364 (-),score=80.03 TRINITY_DN20601_c0_g2_i1:163-1254(-)